MCAGTIFVNLMRDNRAAEGIVGQKEIACPTCPTFACGRPRNLGQDALRLGCNYERNVYYFYIIFVMPRNVPDSRDLVELRNK